MIPHHGGPGNTVIPIITHKALVLLLITLTFALVDFALSLVNFGLTSLFIGLAASSLTIIHALLDLCIIIFRWRFQSKFSRSPNRWNELPPTSKLSSITMDVLLALLFVGAFAVTIVVQVSDYLGIGDATKVPVAIVYSDAAMELLCGIMLIVRAVVGHRERRWFCRAVAIPLGNDPT
ncbi:hypothetical protein P691DRAFT_807973 [Macrolepiota fuliginosa MF-IS2]|uniref:Uncharacterized protein n=1 Tax=Macrolepiota fuliginosa MF-IS2 TaxID=1400762 RepID=A0A9P5X403_9AGAR|nr:hypothetical protein P691DRAFT_807973 [Macrolepiota fuliginosa MF-IS2]